MSKETRIDTRCGPLHVRAVGSGPVALLWHSLFVDSGSWQRVAPRLGEGRRLILIDGPGHGASADPETTYTLRECVGAALDVLAALGVEEPVDWIGNAWGGHVGIRFAAAHPDRLRSLSTLGTPIASLTPSAARETRILLGIYQLIGPATFIRNAISDTLLSPATRANDSQAVAYVDGQVAGANRRLLRNAVVSISLRREDLSELLPDLQVPTLFVTGANHAGFSPEQARAAAALVPGGQHATVADAAYLVPLEQPTETARIITAFWGALPH